MSQPRESLFARLLRRWDEARCAHRWRYNVEESKGPWTGYIETCERCGALRQVPQ